MRNIVRETATLNKTASKVSPSTFSSSHPTSGPHLHVHRIQLITESERFFRFPAVALKIDLKNHKQNEPKLENRRACPSKHKRG